MLTKTEYKELSKNWGKHSSTYQKYNRYQVRFPMLLKHLDVFKDKNVLEVGSNAGLAGYHIAQVAKSYTGVEEQPGYHKQALETKKSMENEFVDFLNMSIKSYIKRKIVGYDINAVYLSYVLYHFSDKEVKMFEEHILPKLDVIVVQSRYAKRNKKGRRKHNSYGFWHPKNVVKFLGMNGFTTELEFDDQKKFHFVIGKKERFPIKISRKVPTGIQLKTFDVEEKPDGDKGSGEIYTESKITMPKRRSTSGRQTGTTQRKPRSPAQRKTATQGARRAVCSKVKDSGDQGVLQSGMEKSAEKKVRNQNIQEVEKTPRHRCSPASTKDSGSQNKPAVQKRSAQGDGVRDKD